MSTHAPASSRNEGGDCMTAKTRRRRLLAPVTRVPPPVRPRARRVPARAGGARGEEDGGDEGEGDAEPDEAEVERRPWARTEKRDGVAAEHVDHGTARSSAATTPLPQRTTLSASRERRNTAVLAPSAERTASSGSRRTVRARTRLATLEQAITKSRPEAAKSTQSTVLARELIWSCIRVTAIW